VVGAHAAAQLAEHGIGTIGRGRLARLTERDLAQLIEAERQPVPTPRSGAAQIRAGKHPCNRPRGAAGIGDQGGKGGWRRFG